MNIPDNEELRTKVEEIKRSGCTKCPELAQTRTNIVVAKGNYKADTIIIGQGPGRKEDEEGLPFVGPAGMLLHSIISAAGYVPDKDFYFSNVTYCHIPGNLKPSLTYLQNCSSYVKTVTSPFRKILALGISAVEGILTIWGREYLTKATLPMGKILTRGQPLRMSGGRYLFICYHPSFLLRNQMTNPQFDEYRLLLNEIRYAKEYQVDKLNESAMMQGSGRGVFQSMLDDSGQEIGLF